jgi:hypothetical protein
MSGHLRHISVKIIACIFKVAEEVIILMIDGVVADIAYISRFTHQVYVLYSAKKYKNLPKIFDILAKKEYNSDVFCSLTRYRVSMYNTCIV